jgi:hypothetical protein
VTDAEHALAGQGLVRALSTTLALWGAANVAGGTAAALSGRGPMVSALGQQSAAWGAINVAIAGAGFWRSRRTPTDLSRLRTILLVNAALDVGYIAAGSVLMASVRGRTDGKAAARRGHGAAVIAQGLGLGAIDTGYAAVATRALHRT